MKTNLCLNSTLQIIQHVYLSNLKQKQSAFYQYRASEEALKGNTNKYSVFGKLLLLCSRRN